jgi:hypothetical protein
MESNAQPKQLMVAKIKLKQQEEFTLCGDPLFGHTITSTKLSKKFF